MLPVLERWLYKAYHSSPRLRPVLRRLSNLGRLSQQPVCITACSSVRPRKALLCYLKSPFRTRRHDHIHSCYSKARAIADVLDQLGFGVDVIDFDAQYRLSYADYDLIIGFGTPFFGSYKESFGGKRILFATGADPAFSNMAEALRIRNLRARRNVLVRPRRTVTHEWAASAVLSDEIVCLGNDWSLRTWLPYNKQTSVLPVTYVRFWPHTAVSCTSQERNRHFVWFGGCGAVHKGLDLILEAMDILDTRFVLHVCGPTLEETDFCAEYHNHLNNRPNVHFHGFVDIRSTTFKEVMERSAFCLLPSCSEGGGSSVYTCMYYGLIPIVTVEASVDIEDYGIAIHEPTPTAIADAMRMAFELETGTLLRRSELAHLHCIQKQSVEVFKAALKTRIQRVSPAGLDLFDCRASSTVASEDCWRNQ